MMSDDEIISNCLTFLFAAYDTTSLTLTCASHLLATHPHVQDKLCSLLDTYWSQHKVRGTDNRNVATHMPTFRGKGESNTLLIIKQLLLNCVFAHFVIK